MTAQGGQRCQRGRGGEEASALHCVAVVNPCRLGGAARGALGLQLRQVVFGVVLRLLTTKANQGDREPFSIVNLALEHEAAPRLSLNIRANDVLQSTDQRFRVDTATLRERTDVQVHQRRLYAGLRYTFGGVTGNDAVRNAMQAAGMNPDSQAAKDAMRMMQGQQDKPAQPAKPAPEKKD
jgi:hypothetical protein